MRENIYKALDALGEALGLDRSESGTETLFHILADTFDGEYLAMMSDALGESHDNGLHLDMRGIMADNIVRLEKKLDSYDIIHNTKIQRLVCVHPQIMLCQPMHFFKRIAAIFGEDTH